MAIERKVVGTPSKYRGKTITVRFMGPDFLGYVNDIELSGFFLSAAAAESAGQRYVNEQLDAEAKRK